MVYLTPRCYSIAAMLLSQPKVITIGDLAKEMQVSERTIRYDLDALEEWMREKNVRLVRKSRVGVYIDKESPAYASLDAHFHTPVVKQQIYSASERQSILLSKILDSPKPHTVSKLAKLVNVSGSTVTRDLDEVEKFLHKYDIRLIRKTNSGVKAQGSEQNMRKAVADIVFKAHSQTALLQLMNRHNGDAREYAHSRQPDLLQGVPTAMVRTCIELLQQKLDVSFTDEAAAMLFVHIGVSCSRVMSGRFVTLDDKLFRMIKSSKEYAVFKSVLTGLGESFYPIVPDHEVGYLTMYALGAGINRNYGDLFELYVDTSSIVEKFILAISRRLDVDLSTDNELKEDLLLDIRPGISRAKFQIEIKAYGMAAIKNQFSQVFAIVSEEAVLLEDHFQVKFSEDAVANFTMHIVAAQERRSQADSYKYVSSVIVCGAGVGTAKLLSSRINREFSQIKVLREFSLAEFQDFDLGSVDIVFTTIPIESYSAKNIIEVDPLLNADSKEKVDRFLGDHLTKYENKDKYLHKIMMIIENHCTIENRARLMGDLEQFLYLRTTLEPVLSSANALNSLITKRTIAFGAEAADYTEAIQIGGRLMVDNGCVTQEYVADMIANVGRFKSNIVIMPSVAMPHAAANGHVNRMCMSLVLLKEPVAFGHEKNDPVKLVICLGAVDNHSHEKAMQGLLSILQSKYLLERILKAGSAEEILLAINNL